MPQRSARDGADATPAALASARPATWLALRAAGGAVSRLEQERDGGGAQSAQTRLTSDLTNFVKASEMREVVGNTLDGSHHVLSNAQKMPGRVRLAATRPRDRKGSAELKSASGPSVDAS